jgi:restriction endonuclease S subunit
MRLRDVCSVLSGYTMRGRLEPAPAGGVLAIQPSDLEENGIIEVGVLIRVDAPTGRSEVGSGDVLFRSRGIRTFACAVPDNLTEPAIALMPLFVIRPDDDGVDSRYLAWALNQSEAQSHFRQSSQGQSIQMVSKRVLEDAPISLPPLARQKQIAAAAQLAGRQLMLERRLVERRYTLLSLQFAHAAQSFSESPSQNRTTR